MSEQNRSARDLWRILPGALISLTALAVLFLLVDWTQFRASLQQAEARFILYGVAFYLVSLFVRARAWHLILLEEIPYPKVFLAMNAGYFLNNVLPLRLGEVGRAYLLGRHGPGFWRVFATILVERAFDVILALSLLLGTLPFVAAIPGSWRYSLAVAGLVLLGLLALFALARKQNAILARFEQLAARWPRLAEQGRPKVSAFLDGLAALAEGRRFGRVLGWMAFGWLLAIADHTLMLRAFSATAQPWWMAFALGVAALGMALPASPASLGIYEAAFVGALALFGIPFEQALAFALVHHAVHVLVSGLFGLYALTQEGQSLGQVFRRVKAQKV